MTVRPMLAALLGGAALLSSGAAAQTFQSTKGAAAGTAEAQVADAPGGPDIVDQLTMTNEGCPDDLTARLSWDRAADLDIRVSGPDSCTVFYAATPGKSGGVLVEDMIPGTCDEGPFEEVIRFASGVAIPGIYRVDASLFSRGGCSEDPIDFDLTVEVGGEEVDTLSGTLTTDGEVSESLYAFGWRCESGGGHRRYEGKSHKNKCPCFNGKSVTDRGFCQDEDELDDYGSPEAGPVEIAPPVPDPETETPETETPETETPEMEAPEMEAPGMEAPEMEAPEMEVPEMAAPEPEEDNAQPA